MSRHTQAIIKKKISSFNATPDSTQAFRATVNPELLSGLGACAPHRGVPCGFRASPRIPWLLFV